jgi:hypothetical protein
LARGGYSGVSGLASHVLCFLPEGQLVLARLAVRKMARDDEMIHGS